MSEQLVFQSRPFARPESWQAIALPELGVEQQPLRVGAWLTEMGETVVAGDPVVEVMINGIVFDVEAPVSGILRRCERLDGDGTEVGETLGWIEPEREPSA